MDTAEPSDWRELARELTEPISHSSPDARDERMLRVAKAMRDAKALDPAPAHYLVSHSIIAIAERRWLEESNPALKTLSQQMQRVAERHGLASDQDWRPGEGPFEYQALNREYERVLDEITAATFAEYGETELGAMYRYDRGRFDELFGIGRKHFFQSGSTQ